MAGVNGADRHGKRDHSDTEEDCRSDEMGQVYEPEGPSGYHEVCLAETEEEVSRGWETCKKNPGHDKFIPADQFSMDHLPVYYRDNLVLSLVRAMADLTVLIKSEMLISTHRPKTYLGSKVPFPFYQFRGEKKCVSGTGRIFKVELDKTCDDYHRRRCKECQDSPGVEKPLAMIYVKTAAHVVYDDSEAEMVKCYLSSGDSDEEKQTKTLRGFQCPWRNEHGDMTDYGEIHHETHDMDLAEKVRALVDRYDKIVIEARDKYGRDFSNTLVILVSHPHGQSKQVSLGDKYDMHSLLELEPTEDIFTQEYGAFRYNAPTCPGSSGAPFYILGLWDKETYIDLEMSHCHSRATGNTTINESSLDRGDYDLCWPLRKEARAAGIKPEVYRPVAEWYRDYRFKLMRFRFESEDLYQEKIKKLKAEMASGITYDNLLKKIPSEDSETREQVITLVQKWGQKLHQLGQDVVYSLELLLKLRENDVIDVWDVKACLDHIRTFLRSFDKEHTGQLDYDSFTDFLTYLRREMWEARGYLLENALDCLEEDSFRPVSLVDVTPLLIECRLQDRIKNLERVHEKRKKSAEDTKLSLQEVKDAGVDSDRLISLAVRYTNIRELIWQRKQQLDLCNRAYEIWKELTAKQPMHTNFEELKKKLSEDSNIRPVISQDELDQRREHNLQQLCEEMELDLSQPRLKEVKDKGQITKSWIDAYITDCIDYHSIHFDEKTWDEKCQDVRRFQRACDFLAVIERLEQIWLYGLPLDDYTDLVSTLATEEKQRIRKLEKVIEECRKREEDDKLSLQKAKDAGVDSDRLISLAVRYINMRELIWQQKQQSDRLNRIFEILTKLITEKPLDTHFEELKKKLSEDSSLRPVTSQDELDQRWEHNLQQLCEELKLELSQPRLKEAKDKGQITKSWVDTYIRYLNAFNYYGAIRTFYKMSYDVEQFQTDCHILAVIERLEREWLYGLSLKNYTDLVSKLAKKEKERISRLQKMLQVSKKLAKDDKLSLQKAKDAGVDSDRLISMAVRYTNIRELIWQQKQQSDRYNRMFEIWKELTAMQPMDTNFEELKKKLSKDSSLRPVTSQDELDQRFEHNLQQLCEELELELSQPRLKEAKDKGQITKSMVDAYIRYLNEFRYDEGWETCSIKSLKTICQFRQDPDIKARIDTITYLWKRPTLRLYIDLVLDLANREVLSSDKETEDENSDDDDSSSDTTSDDEIDSSA